MTAKPVLRGPAPAEEFARHLTSNLNLLWRMGLYLCGHVIQAEALVERIAGQAWEQRATLTDPDRFMLWLLGLTVKTWEHEFTDRLSGGPVYLSASGGEAYELSREAGYAVEDDPAADLAGRLNRDAVCQAFRRIAPEERVVTALSLAADLSYGELGAILGLSRDAVRQRLQRGRAALKLALWEGGGVGSKE